MCIRDRKGDKAIHTIILLGAVLFLGIFLGLSNDDLSTRTRVDIDNGARVLERTGVAAPGGMPVYAPPAAPAGAAPAAGAAGHH